MDVTGLPPQKKRLLALSLLIVIAGSGYAFLSTLYHAAYAAPDAYERAAFGPAPTEISPDARFEHIGPPARLDIPSLGIGANVIDVGMNQKGAMAVPKSYQDVGWYRYGPKPGEAGNAVLAGHVDNGFGLSGVFKNLSTLKIGDEISVADADGGQAVFRVVRRTVLDRGLADTSGIFTNEGPSGLVLITCDGAWVQGEKTYENRLVVFAERIR